MDAMLVLFACLVFIFGFVLVYGAPYLPTMSTQINTAFELLDLKKGDTLLEIGSGDGRILLAAAKRGYQAVGYELNPLLVVISWLITFRYRGQVKIVWGNAFARDWPSAKGIYIFGLPRIMDKLHNKIIQTQAGRVDVISFSFEIPGIKPKAQKNGVFLYRYNLKQ